MKRGILDDLGVANPDKYIDILGNYIAPLDANTSEPLLYPPIHVHHLHMYPSDKHQTQRSFFMERHADSACHRPEPGMKGDECLFRMLPRGHAFQIFQGINTDFELNDVQPNASTNEPLHYYLELGLAWRRKGHTGTKQDEYTPVKHIVLFNPCVMPSP